MKICIALSAIATLATGQIMAQTIIDSDSFFDPEFRIHRNGLENGFFNLSVTNVLESGSSTNATTHWVHSAGGHAQVRSDVPEDNPAVEVDIELAAYTETINGSLVFGRSFSTDVVYDAGFVDVSSEIDDLTDQVLGASIVYNWTATSNVWGLNLAPEQIYLVTFDVTSGAGLPADFLSSATFGITTDGVTGGNNESALSLDLLNLLSPGTNSSTGQFGFYFYSEDPLTALDFSFAASSGLGVSGLGGTAPDQNVLTFSGFQVVAVPEPSGISLCGLFLGMVAFRRTRRVHASPF